MGWQNSWMGTAQGDYSQDWLQDRVRKSARVHESSTQLGGTSSSARSLQQPHHLLLSPASGPASRSLPLEF